MQAMLSSFILLLSLSSLPVQAEVSALEKILQVYTGRNLQIKIKKKYPIPIINKIQQERGQLYLQKGKFRYTIKSSPPKLMLFDGKYFWYQGDTSKKLMIKFSQHPIVQILLSLFDKQKFFKTFELLSMEKTEQGRLFHLKPRKQVAGVKELQLKTGKYIQALKLIWQDEATYQEYVFSNPWFVKKLPESLFRINEKNLDILMQNCEPSGCKQI